MPEYDPGNEPQEEPPEELQEAAPSEGPRYNTEQEAIYLRRLIDDMTPVVVKVRGGEVVHGVIEYYDGRFIRLTREGAPNLFIFKRDIKYLYEEGLPKS